MLDRTTETAPQSDETQRPIEPAPRVSRNPFANLPQRVARVYDERGLRGVLHRAGQFFVIQSFSSLTRRIVFLNVAGLLALVIGILYLSQFRANLIGERIDSLSVQGEIIANAIATSGTVDTYSPFLDRDRQLELQLNENYGPIDDTFGLEFSINPERVAPVLRPLVLPTKTRARVYDNKGYLLLDSRNL